MNAGNWACGYCLGDHRSKDCPAQIQNVQALQMLQLLGFNMVPSPISGMQKIGMLAPPGTANLEELNQLAQGQGPSQLAGMPGPPMMPGQGREV